MEEQEYTIIKTREYDGHDCWGKIEYRHVYKLFAPDGQYLGEIVSIPSTLKYRLIER